jgi:hypothetical protein
LTKIVRAKAKVSHWESTQELKHVADDNERVKVQQKYAKTEAVVFKSTKENKDMIELMRRTAYKMARTKEGMHKATAKVKKFKKTNVKRKLSQKIAQLQSSIPVKRV